MNELETYISSYFGIRSISKPESISSLFEHKVYNKGAMILQEGKICNYLNFVQSGLFRLFAYVDGKEVTQWISTKGYFVVDLSSFMTQTPSKWNIQAITDGELYAISKTQCNQLEEVVPEWKKLEKLIFC